jgi:hypothetical protein
MKIKNSLQSLLLNEKDNALFQRIWSLYLDFVDFFKKQKNSSINDKSQISELMIRKLKIKGNFCERSEKPIEEIFKPIF